MKSLNIQIVEGGERLYIHPLSYHDYDQLEKNKIKYLDGQEFEPYDCDEFILSCSPYFKGWYSPIQNKFLRFYFCYIKRFLVALFRWVNLVYQDAKGGYGLRWSLGVRNNMVSCYYRIGVPVICESMLPYSISVDGQLAVQDKDDLSRTYYLNPTQKYLQQKIDEWLQTPSEYKHIEEDKAEYLKWVEEQTAKGCKIGFLCSLDT